MGQDCKERLHGACRGAGSGHGRLRDHVLGTGFVCTHAGAAPSTLAAGPVQQQYVGTAGVQLAGTSSMGIGGPGPQQFVMYMPQQQPQQQLQWAPAMPAAQALPGQATVSAAAYAGDSQTGNGHNPMNLSTNMQFGSQQQAGPLLRFQLDQFPQPVPQAGVAAQGTINGSQASSICLPMSLCMPAQQPLGQQAGAATLQQTLPQPQQQQHVQQVAQTVRLDLSQLQALQQQQVQQQQVQQAAHTVRLDLAQVQALQQQQQQQMQQQQVQQAPTIRLDLAQLQALQQQQAQQAASTVRLDLSQFQALQQQVQQQQFQQAAATLHFTVAQTPGLQQQLEQEQQVLLQHRASGGSDATKAAPHSPLGASRQSQAKPPGSMLGGRSSVESGFSQGRAIAAKPEPAPAPQNSVRMRGLVVVPASSRPFFIGPRAQLRLNKAFLLELLGCLPVNGEKRCAAPLACCSPLRSMVTWLMLGLQMPWPLVCNTN